MSPRADCHGDVSIEVKISVFPLGVCRNVMPLCDQILLLTNIREEISRV